MKKRNNEYADPAMGQIREINFMLVAVVVAVSIVAVYLFLR